MPDLLEDNRIRDIVLSDVGTESLLSRLKQSTLTAKEVALYVKKCAVLEAENLGAVRKLARNTREGIHKTDLRGGSFVKQFDEIVKVTERGCDLDNTHVASLQTMHDELMELVKQIDKSRKSIKESALRQEKNLQDAEQLAEKAKAKYDGLCEEYERMRTGDPTKNVFGFKHSRTPQHEEELHRKVISAESDYQQRVDTATRLRKDLLTKQRPSTTKQLTDLIMECDTALSFQLAKYANANETLALNRGFLINPAKEGMPSMRETAGKIDNSTDLYNFVITIPKHKRQLNRPVITFKKHPSLSSAYPQSSPSVSQPSNVIKPTKSSSSGVQHRFSAILGGASGAITGATAGAAVSSAGGGGGTTGATSAVVNNGIADKSPSQHPVPLSPAASTSTGITATASAATMSPPQAPPGVISSSVSHMPVYGTPLDVLLDYEESTVPKAVYQCVQAVDHFGLEVENIYRTNGNNAQVQEIKRLFDADADSVDLLHPSKELNDIHSVASALKLYMRELPDPLLTNELHREFIAAAKINDDVQRRDAVHATVNKLPDANYTTLRYLIFHLYRVQEREAINRMSIGNLAIVWGPTLMATDYANVSDMAVQGRVLETILFNAYVIFDAE